MLEKDIEAAACRWAKAQGWISYKFTSPARRSVPDRMFIREGRVVFIEFKKPGGKATEKQKREIEKLRAAEVEAYVADSVQAAKEYLTYGCRMNLKKETDNG